MLIYNQMRCFCWQKDKVLIFSMILAFQRRHEEGAKKAYRREKECGNAFFIVLMREFVDFIILCSITF